MRRIFFSISCALILLTGCKVTSVSVSTVPLIQTQTVQPQAQNQTAGFTAPIADAAQRITKKPFGIYITPKTSPIQPEKFIGYHAGTDFETVPNEQDSDVLITAACSGKLLEKKYASGYGGVAVQACTFENQPVTVIYGHLKLASITSVVGSNLDQGAVIGVLGKGFSTETDGERKHLHLGIHKGAEINILGYVDTEAKLPGWIDPATVIQGLR